MSDITFGQLDSWNSDARPRRTSREDFANIRTPGQYVFRVCTEPPFKYAAHWVEIGTAPNVRKIKVNCAGRDCVLCKQGNKAEVMYVVVALNREGNRPQLLEFKRTIYDGFCSLNNDTEDWGSLVNYDVKIEHTKKGGKTFYDVKPKPKKALTAEEKAIVKEFEDRVDLHKFTAPTDNEEIERRIAQASSGGFGSGGGFTQSFGQRTLQAEPTVVVPPNGAAPSENDPDFEFT